ncbi:MAG: anthranilate phosphoribosyltransferase [Spirochaetes bacterium RIFOXYB1_FULL_32_8]|nr:MAG: anthranilate phosphoribosyltransferase [Spirochaetes bacterium GWE1_32_154]OHD44644.1 MAG: anthranilate phosphoribosyltransferase [Spirochaetes bacterium GWE2_31_10]OHD80668.1 MAG: anthranilate phosphoribosyltransferase [Spirochaetes bacterium RIFOXYB1_FULL_32_8]HBI39299.1 bifunctional anthranilate synthase component II/anthranilate phosphoribosyltransferase [Spirochaetia bacterium]
MILMLDNYDSFTYNLYQVFMKFNYPIKVVRSDKITIEEIEQLNPTFIVLSPGPGTPHEAGICIEVVQKLKGKYPILGICLGHQAILAAFDVPIVNASRIVHGKVEKLNHTGTGLFRNINADTMVTRYHSLAGKEKDIPDCFEITAKTEDGEVMAVEHKEYQLAGMQFHPESIGTKDGEKMIMNFLHYRRETVPVKQHIKKTLGMQDLTYQESYDIMDELTEGNMTDAQIGSLLTSLQIKGVTSNELAGFASVLKKKAVSFPKPAEGEKRIDTCGTGGSHNKTFNVSTIVSLITSAAGAKVVKHGNRAVTSTSGSADLFEKLGINVDMSVERCIEIYNKIGVTFLYARKFHAAMRFAAAARASLGFRTAFNLIGPLSNPAYSTHQIIGVFDKDYTKTICESLSIMGTQRAMVVSGLDGYDEISLTSDTQITELNNGWIKTYNFSPSEIGLPYYKQEELAGGNVECNSLIAMNIIAGKDGPKTELVAVNAGAALYIYGLASSIKDGYHLAKSVIHGGKAKGILDEFILLSNS